MKRYHEKMSTLAKENNEFSAGLLFVATALPFRAGRVLPAQLLLLP